MKKILYPLFLLFIILYLLVFPKDGSTAALQGLLLWYQKVLPVLLPFSILSNILLSSNSMLPLCQLLYRPIRLIYPISPLSVYPLITGFLFGFPMGSQITASLIQNHQLSSREGAILMCICNNIGPAFIGGFVAIQPYFEGCSKGWLFLCLYLPPLVLGRIWFQLEHLTISPVLTEKTASRSQINFKIIDAGIMNGFEVLTRIGGYIMFFSILADMLKKIPLSSCLLQTVLIGLTEVTNGIQLLLPLSCSTNGKQLLAMLFVSFGGISGLFQSSIYLTEAKLSMKSYTGFRILCMSFTFLLYLLGNLDFA